MGLYWPEEALLEHRETSSFPDQHIWDLTDLYTDEKHSVACILLVQPLTESLSRDEKTWWGADKIYNYIHPGNKN